MKLHIDDIDDDSGTCMVCFYGAGLLFSLSRSLDVSYLFHLFHILFFSFSHVHILTSPPPLFVPLKLLTSELAEDGYAGVEVRLTQLRTEIIIRATRPQHVLGEKGQRIRELTAVVQKRFSFAADAVELYAERVAKRGLCAQTQAESLKYKLLGGLAVRRACYGVLRFIMESGAKGAEVIVAGKLRAQRAKAMKFSDG